MAFADTIRNIPFTPRQGEASGFLPPMVRAMGHVLYVLGCISDDAVPKTDEECLAELRAAQVHWNARIGTTAVSTAIGTTATNISTAFGECVEEFPGWNADTRQTNLRDLTHRIVQYSADLDRELVGVRDSNPGTTL